jgi:hypothetical protein
MNIRISNQLNMAGTILNLCNLPEHKAVWLGQAPSDFEADLIIVGKTYGNASTDAALAEGATGGAGDAKAAAETVLENCAYILTRALCNHFKKTGDLDRLGKANMSKTSIVELRNQLLVAKCTEIRDLALVAQLEVGASGRGVTAARTATLTAAITGYTNVMNVPRGQIINRSTLLKEVETTTASIVEQLNDMDDLVLQFNETPAGLIFIAAWKKARMIIDLGGGGTPAAPGTTPTP